MKSQIIYRSNWAMSVTLLLIFAIVGCQPPAPTRPPESSLTAESTSPPESLSPTPSNVESTATSQPSTNANALYQDVFTNPSTGWDEAKLGNYFVGYHAPEWYHIEIGSSNSKVAISEPSRTSYEDVTIEAQIFAVAAKTDPSGDFRYGLAFRRSGDQYYAFTISPNTKKWEMLKVSPDGIESLQEGTDDSIHDRDAADLLRIDAAGSNFLLHINDHIVGQATDDAYSSGEVGLYAESIDSPKIHIHYDTFTIRDLTLDLACSINGGTVNVRSGPGKTYPQLAILSDGDNVKALGISPNNWVEIQVEGSDAPGWVSYSDGYMSCTPTVNLFPVVSP